MITPLQKADTSPINRQPVSRADRQAITDPVEHRRLEPYDAPDRRLRNRIILANALVWVLIAFTLGILLF